MGWLVGRKGGRIEGERDREEKSAFDVVLRTGTLPSLPDCH